MKMLIHTSLSNAECVIDGKGFSIPPNRPFKVPSIKRHDYVVPEEYVAEKILAHCWHYGIVDIPCEEVISDTGVEYKYDTAAIMSIAREKLIAAEEQILANYVEISQSRMSQQLPALPPSKTVDAVIRRRGIDIAKEYNIKPVGYGVVAQAASTANELIEARAESAELRQRLERLEAAITNQKNGKKGD